MFRAKFINLWFTLNVFHTFVPVSLFSLFTLYQKLPLTVVLNDSSFEKLSTIPREAPMVKSWPSTCNLTKTGVCRWGFLGSFLNFPKTIILYNTSKGLFKNPVKDLRWSFFVNIVNVWNTSPSAFNYNTILQYTKVTIWNFFR